jgi:hypothetical protein
MSQFFEAGSSTHRRRGLPSKQSLLGNPDSVGFANADAWQLGKALLEGFLGF